MTKTFFFFLYSLRGGKNSLLTHEALYPFMHVALSKRFTWCCYIANIKTLGPVVSDKKIFSCFPYVKYLTHGVGPFLAPGN